MRRYRLWLMPLVLMSAGCELTPKPWVMPYERQLLADPIMQFDRTPMQTRFLDHTHDVREGARGAQMTEGGGCGCN